MFNHGNDMEKSQEPGKGDDTKVYRPAARCGKRRPCPLIPQALMVWAGAGEE